MDNCGGLSRRISGVKQQPSRFTPALEDCYRSQQPLRTLLALYREDWGNLSLSMLFYVIKHSPVWITPLIIANVVDIISQPDRHSLSELWLNGLLLAASIVQNIPTHYLHIRFISTATRKMETRLRSAIARRLQQLSLGFYHQNSSGALQAKLLQDVPAIELLTTHLFQFVPSAVLTILVAIAATVIRAPWFLGFFLITVPAAILLIRGLKDPISDRNHRFRQQLEELSARLIEMIQLIPVTRAHGIEAVELQRVEGKLRSVQTAALQLDGINAITNASAWVTFRLFDFACLMLAGWLAFTGRLGISVGDVVLLTGYFTSLTNSVMQITQVLPQVGKGFEAIRSVGEILECPDLELNQGKARLQQVEGHFSFDAVSFSYANAIAPALHNLELEVTPGETLAIVGPSGAGKSTLLNLVIGFLRPTRGRILLDGQDMNALDLQTYRRFLSVVSQQTLLFEGTVRENILYGTDSVRRSRLHQVLEDAQAEEFIRQLPQGLDTRIGENGIKLSGGQRQRLAIARALIRNPRILILDEATAALDTVSEALIQRALERLMQGRTTFVVAHRLSTIRNADRVVVLEAGRIAEIGPHQQLLAQQGLYAKLYALQA